MKVRVTTSQMLELDGNAVKECFEKYLETLGGGADCYLDAEGVVWEEDEYRHGTPTSSKVKNPSEVQKAALRLKRALADDTRKQYEEEEKKRKRVR